MTTGFALGHAAPDRWDGRQDSRAIRDVRPSTCLPFMPVTGTTRDCFIPGDPVAQVQALGLDACLWASDWPFLRAPG